MINLHEVLSSLFPNGKLDVDWTIVGSPVGQTISFWNDALGPQPTQEQIDAVTQEQIDSARLAKLRNAAKQFQADQQAQNVALRATVKLLVDELNILRGWVADFKAATAAAGSLAALKTGVAALPNTPQRTYQQAKTAINNLIDGE